jgi:hypothetical protein
MVTTGSSRVHGSKKEVRNPPINAVAITMQFPNQKVMLRKAA